MLDVTKKYLAGRRKGQAAIEFITLVVVIFFFLFFMLSLSITLVVSDYVEYATFMAARTYKAMASSEAKQEELGRQEFNRYIERINGIARNFNLEFVQAVPGDPRTAGARVSYDIDLFYLPPMFVPTGQPPSTITLTTEAYLGRDPSFEDCINRLDQLAGQLGFGIQGTGLVQQMADNAC